MACKPALIANAKSLSGCFINVLSYVANPKSLPGCFINVLLLEIKFSEPHRELCKLRARIGLTNEISQLE